MALPPNVEGIECRFVVPVSPKKYGEDDVHIIKELIHYKDGTTKPNVRVIKGYKRPYWITKPHLRNYNDNREWGRMEEVDKYVAQDKDLINDAGNRLQIYGKNKYKVFKSPYLFGAKTSASVYIKHAYRKRFANIKETPFNIGYLDTEADLDRPTYVAYNLKTYKLLKNTIDLDELKKWSGLSDKVFNLFISFDEEYWLEFLKDSLKKKRITNEIYNKFLNVRLRKHSPISILTYVTTEGAYAFVDERYLKKQNLTVEEINAYTKEKIGEKKAEFSKENKDKNGWVWTRDISINTIACKGEGDILEKAFATIHKSKIDLLAIWNIAYDMPSMLRACAINGLAPKRLFSDPSVPEEMRHFKWCLGPLKKVSRSGQVKRYDKQEQWHTAELTAGFYFIDQMCSYSAIRLGSPKEQFYNVDAIANKLLGMGKLYLKVDEGIYPGSIEWHSFLTNNHFKEYTAYAFFDVIVMLLMNDYTRDLDLLLPTFVNNSQIRSFTTRTQMLSDNFQTWLMDNENAALGAAGLLSVYQKLIPDVDLDDCNLQLRGIIVNLDVSLVRYKHRSMFEDAPHLKSTVRRFAFDMDAVSAYLSAIVRSNLSRETCLYETYAIDGKSTYDIRRAGLDLLMGHVSAIDFCTNMFNFPTITELCTEYEKEIALLDEKKTDDVPDFSGWFN